MRLGIGRGAFAGLLGAMMMRARKITSQSIRGFRLHGSIVLYESCGIYDRNAGHEHNQILPFTLMFHARTVHLYEYYMAIDFVDESEKEKACLRPPL